MRIPIFLALFAVTASVACSELTGTSDASVTLLADTGTYSIPATLFDGQSRHVVMRLRAADGSGLYSTGVVWTSSADSVVRIDQSAFCEAHNDQALLAETHACLVAKSSGVAKITVKVNQAGLAPAETTFTVVVNERWTDVAASDYSTCAVNAKNKVYCWGAPELTGTGRGEATQYPRVLLNPTGLPFDRVFAGATVACGAVASTDILYCWGVNQYGAAGLGKNIFIAPVPTLPLAATLTSVAFGSFTSCGITSKHHTTCWGLDQNYSMGIAASDFNELCGGLATTEKCVYAAGSQGTVDDSVVAVGVGWFHFCNASGVASPARPAGVRCWGTNHNGELGRGFVGDEQPEVDAVILPMAAGDSASIAGAGYHTCAVVGKIRTANSPTYCWGNNFAGEVGSAGCDVQDDYTCAVTRPRRVSMDFVSVIAGNDFSCGRTFAGAAYCWGANAFGQLGIGGSSPLVSPPQLVKLESGRVFTKLAGGFAHVCGLTQPDGGIYCWGNNSNGNLGDGTLVQRMTPVRVAEPTTALIGLK